MIKILKKNQLMMLACLFAMFLNTNAFAQQEIASASTSPQSADADVKSVGETFFDENGQAPSLLFTYWERNAINDAKSSIGLARAPTESELMQDLNSGEAEPKPKPPAEERYINLSGIAYKKSSDWVIWLNNQRVTPDALPKEILDINVYKGYVELKWFDDYSNQIFPIRLRPNQRFNIDTRIFLPG